MTSATDVRLGRRQATAWALLALVLALSATAGADLQALRSSRHAARATLVQHSGDAAERVNAEVEGYENAVREIAAGVAAQSNMTSADFATLSAPLAVSGLGGASGLLFVVPALDPEIATLQQHWRTAGDPSLTLSPAHAGGEHFFSVVGRSLDGRPVIYGRDLSSAPEPRGAMIASRLSRGPVVSDAYVLLKDRDLPKERQQLSLVLVAPVIVPTTGVVSGWVLVGMRGADLLTGLLRTLLGGEANATLSATSASGARAVVARYDTGHPSDPTMSESVTVQATQQRWTLTLTATRAAATRHGAQRAVVVGVLGVGVVLSLLLAAIVFLILSSRARSDLAVQLATSQLRAAQDEASRQAALLAAVVNSISDGVGVVDEHGSFLLHNPAAKSLLGVVDDIAEVDTWQEHYGMFTMDGRTPFPLDELPLVRALEGVSTDHVDMIIRNAGNPDGRPITVSGRPLDPEAGVRGAVAVFHDLTARLQGEAELRDSEARRRAILDTAADAFVAMDHTGAITDWNAAAVRLLGHDAHAVIGRSLAEVLVPADLRQAHTAGFLRFVGSGQRSLPDHPIEVMALHRDGHQVAVELTVSRLEWEGGWRIHGFLRDITARRAAAEELRAAEELFRFAFDRAPVGMALNRLRGEDQGRMVRVNNAFASMLGYSVEQLQERTFLDITHPDDRTGTRAQLAAVLAAPDAGGRFSTLSAAGVEYEKRYLHADGHTVWVAINLAVLRDPQEQPVYAVVQVEDITVRRAETERLSALALRDPLTGLANRVLLTDRIRQAVARSARNMHPVSVLFCDLDGFKSINDTYGHAAGDDVLRQVATAIRSAVRPSDTVARLGGDEFVVLCEDLHDAGDARIIANRINDTLRRPIVSDGHQLTVGCSIGLFTAAGPGLDPDELLHQADLRMYTDKRARAALIPRSRRTREAEDAKKGLTGGGA